MGTAESTFRRGIVVFAFLVGTTLAAGQDVEGPAPGPSVASDIPGVVKGGTTVELVRADFGGSEGPVAMPDGSLLFTTGPTITRVDPQGRITTYLDDTRGVTGLAYDRSGRLIGARTEPPSLVVLAPQRSVLADTIDGLPFLRPNDLTIDARGGIYFSDQPRRPDQQAEPRRTKGLLYRRSDGMVIQVADGIEQPNGLVLSPDERVLYAADARGEWVLAYDVRPDGSLANRREFARLEGVPSKAKMDTQTTADGLAVDGEGRLYVASRTGVEVFDRTGHRLGVIPVIGGTGPQNLAFAGTGKDVLFVVGRRALWRVQMIARGFAGRAK